MRTSKRLRTTGAIALTVAALTLAAACGDDDDAGDDTGPADDTAVVEPTDAGPGTTGSAGTTAGTGTAPAGDGEYVIGVSNTLAGNGWREEMICAVKAQSLASGSVSRVVSISKNGGPTDQIQDLQNLISEGVNAIIVNPSDREQLNPVIEEAIAQGIVVVAVDQAVTAEGAYVATNDQVEYGRLGAEWLAGQIGGEGRVLYMRGIDGVPADADRHQGFTEVMEGYPDIEIKEVFTGWDFTKGGDIAVQELTAGDYDGIWTSGIDYTVVNAFETVGKDPVPVVGADNNAFIGQLLDGKPGAAVTNPAVIGGVGTAIALEALSGESPEQTTLLTPQVWDAESSTADLEANYFEDRDDTFSSAVSVEGYTSYTPEQLFACKGPGE
ncbi:MAG: substrate-binding domain-containing protein [Acidimicrobiia bacterium]|nr:substrate-binding domain-containing protein [Acidimicrobiia bacterium]